MGWVLNRVSMARFRSIHLALASLLKREWRGEGSVILNSLMALRLIEGLIRCYHCTARWLRSVLSHAAGGGDIDYMILLHRGGAWTNHAQESAAYVLLINSRLQHQ